MQTILYETRTSIQGKTTLLVPQVDGGVNWRTTAVAAYRRVEQEEWAALPAVLADRIRELTGHMVALSAIWVDRKARTASVAVDGVTFRLHQGTMTMIRPCATASMGYVESAPITHRSDLGQALLAWDAADDDASAADDEDWSHSW